MLKGLILNSPSSTSAFVFNSSAISLLILLIWWCLLRKFQRALIVKGWSSHRSGASFGAWVIFYCLVAVDFIVIFSLPFSEQNCCSQREESIRKRQRRGVIHVIFYISRIR